MFSASLTTGSGRKAAPGKLASSGGNGVASEPCSGLPGRLRSRLKCILVGVLIGSAAGEKTAPSASPPAVIRPAASTAPVAHDADDPAVWVHPTDPARSLILGTDKAAAPLGGLSVYDLQGAVRQRIPGIDRPNNVDVQQGVSLGGRSVDLAVLTERYRHRLRAFRIEGRTGRLEELTGSLEVFAGQSGPHSEPMGVSLYRRPRDGALSVIVSRKSGPSGAYLWQYRLLERGGRLSATKVREFGTLARAGEVEAVVVDDALGFVYYAEENYGIHKWHADPAHPGAARELACFGTTGFEGDREGLALYAGPNGTGYLAVADQREGDSRLHLFSRKAAPGRPHQHPLLGTVRTGADSTDGIEITATPLGNPFPEGVLVAMNSAGKNFLLFRWRDVEAGLSRTAR